MILPHGLSMKAKDKGKLLPEQETGKPIEASAKAVLKSEDEAKALFQVAKKRLQNVSAWHITAKNISAEFHLVTAKGAKLHREPKEGDYFKIDIPGPGTQTGNGFDWVRVERVDSTDNGSSGESFGIRVRPSENPTKRSTDVAHFYSSESTSTFVITRQDSTVKAEVFDRNTKPNEEAGRAGDKIRDAVVGTAGLAGFSKLQWKGLVEGLIAQE